MMDPEDTNVRITVRDIYTELVALRHAINPVATMVPDHEKRIRTLERWAYALPPTFLAALITSIIAWNR